MHYGIADGRRIIMVLNGMPSKGARKQESIRLMGWAFANFEDVTLFNADAVIERAPVWLGTEASVPLVAAQELVLTMPRNWRQTAQVKLHYDAPIPAPVAKDARPIMISGRGPGRRPAVETRLVSTGPEPEGDVDRLEDLARRDARDLHQRPQAGPRRLAEDAQAVAGQDPVLAEERHQVGHRPQRHEVQEFRDPGRER